MAWRFAENGQAVTLIEDEAPAGASRVAAGLFNVITGRMGAKTWMAEELMAALKTFFQQLPASCQEAIHPAPIYRPFKSVEEYNKWTGRSVDPAFAAWADFLPEGELFPPVKDPLGGIMIKGCGWVDIPTLLDRFKQHLEAHHSLKRMHCAFQWQDFQPEEMSWQGPEGRMQVDHLVLCQGYRLAKDAFFPPMDLRPNKGEIMEVEIPRLNLPWVLSRKIYLIPRGNHRYTLGATYANRFADLSPSAEGREEMLAHLQAAIDLPVKVLKHRAGVRATTPNRRPALGAHPQWPEVFVLNGLGTKGLLQAPYFSQLLYQYIQDRDTPIPPAVQINRLFKQ